MTRARWLTGALIGAGALVVAGEALGSYIAGHLVVGVVAVLVLMGVLAIGMYSLARARRYIARELVALRAQPPGGALYDARRAEMLALRRRGVAPDLDVLAESTAAEEAERGYTGKYLVATTVLIGLVGTFGGLMETLARVAPLLKGDLGAGGPAGALGLIAGPLAGLHVTFGTSVVAILVTLALALVQGDVTLHHERLLALLQERTRHVLVPELWPDAESAAERTVRALGELRAFVAETLTTGAAASAERVAAVVRLEVHRLVEQVGAETRAASLAQTAALERAGASISGSLREVSEASARELREAATTSREAMTTAATSARDALAAAATESRAAIVAASSSSQETLAAAATESRAAIVAAASSSQETLAASAASSRETFEQAASSSREAFEAAAAETRALMATAVAALAETTARTSAAFSESTGAAVAGLGELSGSLSAQLEGSSRALAAAAAELHGTVEVLSPALAELSPQLGALAAEVALLAARADSPEQPNAVLDELVRLGEDVERLVAASQAPVAADSFTALETES
jgi:hypothetical protein